MSDVTQAPPPAGPYIEGTIVRNPNDVVPAGDLKAHAFFNVIRELLTVSNFYHSEGALGAAVTAVTEFEKHILEGDHRSVLQEHDIAPREDVSKRIAPQVGTGAQLVPTAGAGLDYNRLAAAIVALQQQQAAEHEQEGPPA